MTTRERKAESDMIRVLWTAIKHYKSMAVPASKITKYLVTEVGMMEDHVDELLNNAVEDGLVEVTSGSGSLANRNSRKSPTRSYRIPTENGELINDIDHDLYCFECHRPTNLQKCSSCARAFHVQCVQDKENNSDSQNTSPHSFSESINDSGIATGDPSLTISNENATETIRGSAKEKESSNPPADPIESKPSLKTENTALGDDAKAPGLLVEIQPDVICLGEIRPPSRRKRRLMSSYNKAEANIHIEPASDGEEARLCSSCRLQHSAALTDPPLQLDEMNYLLKFIFARIKTWITADTYSPLPCSSIPMPSKQEFDLFQKKCLKFPKTLEYIDKKLKADSFKSLKEFQCDIMDIKHSIGVLYGVKSAEYEAVGYLLRDCAFELSEIRKCPDCYRHSNEKTNEHWFCKPCVPRHELVFAKQIGYTHWPAKVIKFENRRYDVRFFGNQHLRAVIDASHVLPIDTDIASLKLKKVVSFNKAMDELHRHQELLQWPAGCFSYEAERQNPVDLTGLSPGMGNKKVKAAKAKKFSNNSIASSDLESTIENGATASNAVPALATNANSFISMTRKSDLPTPIKQTLKVRLKRTKPNSATRELVDESIVGVSPSKKSKPSSSSTPITKQKAMRGRKKLKIGDQAEEHALDENSTAPNVIPSTDDLDPQVPQTNSQGSNMRAHSPQQRPKSATPAKMNSKAAKQKPGNLDNILRDLQGLKCPPAACKLAIEALQVEIERSAEIVQQLTEKQNRALSETKKKQWCYHCEKEAIYYCCWNTAYCSTECQQKHWHTEHKKTCRRKR